MDDLTVPKRLQLSWQDFSSRLPDDLQNASIELDRWVSRCFANRQHESYSLWLDSAAKQHPDSRYHILLKAPEFVLSASSSGTHLTRLRERCSELLPEPSDIEYTSMLDAASQIMRQCQSKIATSNPQGLPFSGGFAGILGYDLGRQLENLPTKNVAEYQMPDACLGFYTEALMVDKQTAQLWVLAPTGEHSGWVDSWLSSCPGDTEPFKLTSNWQSNMTRAYYQRCFQQVRNYLLAGDCYQTNLAQRFSAQYQGDEWHAYQQLRSVNDAPFSAFMRVPEGCILSVSPERFLAVDSTGQVQTKPIKGTRPRASDTEQDAAQREQLLASEKDRAENLMIVDLLRNDLSRSCRPGSIDVPQLFAIESFPAVHHLVSTVVGQLSPDKTAIDLVRAAFPGGSITGAPKIRAMEIIEELEPNRRSVYCGSMAYFSIDGNCDSSITIRTILAERQHLYCWAGGGLVIDSEEHSEYQETLDKVARILPVLESV
ncbi:MAG: aminodeoxychorismate synthase component I [Pseudomonadota bacterium]